MAAWRTEHLGRAVSYRLGWDSLQRLKQRRPAPRPALAVATAHPQATVERWATDSPDEHRIGLKPLLRRVWAPVGQRPTALVRHRFAWRSLVGCVHPASGRTIFHRATTVSIPLFAVELEAFARAVGPTPNSRSCSCSTAPGGLAGWHSRVA